MIEIEFSGSRFWHHFLEFSKIGALAGGGVERPFGSQEDLQARAWLIRHCAEVAKLQVNVDPIGNIWAFRPGQSDLPLLAIGSHHDSVPQGGKFDGALGVLVALEVMQSLNDIDYLSRHPLALVSFTAEEPNPFNLSTMGSRTVAGRLTRTQLHAATDWQGRPLAKAIQAVGGNLEMVEQARKTSQELGAFLELHIEQGKRLELAKKPIAIVTGICGIYREEITVQGVANHAGTTLLRDRQDAFLAAAEMALAFETLLHNQGRADVVGTIGRFAITPNAVNIIPGQAQFVLEIRAREQQTIHELASAYRDLIQAIAKRREVTVETSQLLDQAPEFMDGVIMDILAKTTEALQIPYERLASMAGHDATHMASFTRAGMLFVPSIDGKSHCQEEESRLEDIVKAGQILSRAIIELDQTLDQ